MREVCFIGFLTMDGSCTVLELYTKYMQLSGDQLRLSRLWNKSWSSERVELQHIIVHWEWENKFNSKEPLGLGL